MAQRKRAGLITRRTLDRNQVLLAFLVILSMAIDFYCVLTTAQGTYTNHTTDLVGVVTAIPRKVVEGAFCAPAECHFFSVTLGPGADIQTRYNGTH